MYFFDAEQLGRSAHFVCRLGPTHAVKLFGFVSESTARPFCQSLQKPLIAPAWAFSSPKSGVDECYGDVSPTEQHGG